MAASADVRLLMTLRHVCRLSATASCRACAHPRVRCSTGSSCRTSTARTLRCAHCQELHLPPPGIAAVPCCEPELQRLHNEWCLRTLPQSRAKFPVAQAPIKGTLGADLKLRLRRRWRSSTTSCASAPRATCPPQRWSLATFPPATHASTSWTLSSSRCWCAPWVQVRLAAHVASTCKSCAAPSSAIRRKARAHVMWRKFSVCVFQRCVRAPWCAGQWHAACRRQHTAAAHHRHRPGAVDPAGRATACPVPTARAAAQGLASAAKGGVTTTPKGCLAAAA